MANSGLVKKQLEGIGYLKNTLSESEKRAYERMLYGFFDLNSRILISGVTSNRISIIFDKVKRDNPLLFFVERFSYQYIPLRKEGIITPTYRFDRNQIDATNAAIHDKIRNLITQCKHEGSEWNKEKLIHDYICSTVIYDSQFKDYRMSVLGLFSLGKEFAKGYPRRVSICLIL